MPTSETQISTKQLGGLVATLIAIFTLVQFGQNWIKGLEEEAYKEGRGSLQQELNTQDREILDKKIEALEINLAEKLSSLEEKEESKHKEIITLLETKLDAVIKVIEKQEEYLNEEDDGVKGDLLREIEFLQSQINKLKE